MILNWIKSNKLLTGLALLALVNGVLLLYNYYQGIGDAREMKLLREKYAIEKQQRKLERQEAAEQLKDYKWKLQESYQYKQRIEEENEALRKANADLFNDYRQLNTAIGQRPVY
jgi:hypothetical protein